MRLSACVWEEWVDGTAKRHAASIIMVKWFCAQALDSLFSSPLSKQSLIWQLYKWISRKKSSTCSIECSMQNVWNIGSNTIDNSRPQKLKCVCVCDMDQFFAKLRSSLEQIALKRMCALAHCLFLYYAHK